MPFDQPPPSVQEVVVQATRLPEAAGDPAFSIVQAAPEVLQTAERLDDALAQTPGFSLYRRTSSLGANPTTQGVSLRGIAGSGASRVLVTLDGVPQNDPFGGWVIWTGLPVEAISAATVVRGAGSGPYGAGALTGVVALDQPENIPSGVIADVEGGTEGYERGAGIVQANLGAAKVFLDASGEHNDGWVPVRYGKGAADTPLTLSDWSAAERIEVPVGRAVLAERVGAFQEDRGAGTEFAASRASGVQGGLSLVAQPTADQLGWRVQGWIESSNLANTSSSMSLDRNTSTLADNQYATPATGMGLNAAVRRAVKDYFWEVGIDARDFDGDSKELLYNQGKPTGTRFSGGGERVAGVYAEGERTLGATLLTAGARLDGWEDYSGRLIQSGSSSLNQRYPNQGGAAPTGRVGVRQELGGDVYARAAVYAGFRPATLNELHRSFRVGNDVTEANPDLTPEKLDGAEIGLGGTRLIDWDGDVFYNRLANAITNVTIGHGAGTFPLAGFVPAGGTLYERENAGTVNAWGAEGEAHKALGRALTLRAAFTYTHARLDGGSAAPQLTGLRPAETPAITYTASVIWRPAARLTLTAEGRYESARYDDDQNTRRIAPGFGVDGRLEWRVRGNLSAYLAAENLFDADIQTGRSTANVVTYDAPRQVRVGFAYRE
jgi:outer membrane receptor protein involved in Fe transport